MEKPWVAGTVEDGAITSLSALEGVGAVPQHGIAESHLLLHGAAPITILCWQDPCSCVPAPFLLPQVLVGAATPLGCGTGWGKDPKSLEQPLGYGHHTSGCSEYGKDRDGRDGEASRCSPHDLPSAQGATGVPWGHSSPTVTLRSQEKTSSGAATWAGRDLPEAALLHPLPG